MCHNIGWVKKTHKTKSVRNMKNTKHDIVIGKKRYSTINIIELHVDSEIDPESCHRA